MQNVDPAQINQFNDHASQWWDPDGPMKTLHAINPLRLDFIQSHAALSNQAVLDVGCGGGILCEAMAANGANVTGIDMASDLVKIAKLHALGENLAITYEQTNVDDFAKTNPAGFDVITCMEMLEHVPDPLAIVNACQQLVKPGGHVFFSTLNRNPKAYVMAVIGAEYILKLLPKGTHDYARFIKPSELSNWARAAQLTTSNIKGIRYNPLNQTFSLTNDVSVNYLLHTQNPRVC